MPRKSNPEPRRVTVVRYEDDAGRRCKSSDPGAKKVVTTSESYYLFLPPKKRRGKRECVPLETADLAVAWVKTRQILQDRLHEELGILSDRERQAARPIEEHLEEWLTSVADGGANSAYVATMRSRMQRLVALAKWRRIGDIKKASCLRALASLQADETLGRGVGRGRGVSAETRNHYRKHARQFSRHLHLMGRLEVDPLATLDAVSVEDDRRHDRRVPDELEVQILFDHLDGRQPGFAPRVRMGMSGPRRALGYQMAMCAGLRAGELRRLTPASFDWAKGEVRITAGSDKAKKRRRLAIPGWLAAKLRAWIEAGGQLWGSFPQNAPGRLLRADLDLARKGHLAAAKDPEERAAREASTVCRYEVDGEDGPLYWDMHSLRHWYITQVAATDGISPSTLQALSRHADPKLTLEVYARAKEGGVRAAVEQLPRLDGGGESGCA